MLRVGVIANAHGIRGEVRIRSFTAEPGDVLAYGDLFDESGARRFRVHRTGAAKGVILARIDGIGDRDAAERLKGTALFIPRAALPEPGPEEYYHTDLIGLNAELVGDRTGGDARGDARPLGKVIAVNDFGAGPILEIALPGAAAVMVPFTAAVVPTIDLDAGRIGIVPVPGLLGGEGSEQREESDAAGRRKPRDAGEAGG